MIVMLFVTHMNYFESRAPGSMCMMILLVTMLSLSVMGIGASVLVHLYGFVAGMLIGLAFYPKHN